MRIEFTARHIPLEDGVRQYAESKIAKLERFLDEPVEAHLILELEKRRQIAELLVSHRHGTLQASEAAEDMRDAIHAVVEKVEKQARRGRKKHTDKRRRAPRPGGGQSWPLEIVEAASLSGGQNKRVIRTTSLPIKPMSIDEAALELDRSKNEFFVFRDSTTERVSVLYRRKDDHYGLISPDH